MRSGSRLPIPRAARGGVGTGCADHLPLRCRIVLPAEAWARGGLSPTRGHSCRLTLGQPPYRVPIRIRHNVAC